MQFYFENSFSKKTMLKETESWGGVDGWGEKTYNCNWMTIKIKKKKKKETESLP